VAKDGRTATLLLVAISIAMIIAWGRTGLHDVRITVLPLTVLAAYRWAYEAGVKQGREDEREEVRHG
jgi:hypothetical protein